MATGTKISVSHVGVLFCLCVVQKATAHVETKTLNMRHQAQKGFSRHLHGNTTAPKRIPGLRTQY